MSEARKKLTEEDKLKEMVGKRYTEELPTSQEQVERIRRKEQEVKDEIKRKKEELRMKHEEKMRFLKKEMQNSIDSEYRDSIKYDTVAKEMQALGWTSEAMVLRRIANEERSHKSELERILNYSILKFLKT
jgi:hypothetical protein